MHVRKLIMVNKSIIFVFCCVLQLAGFAAGTQLKNCNSKSPVQLSLTQSPNVLPIKNNALFHVSAGFQIKNYELPRKLRVLVDVSKKMLFWVKIPCIGCDFSLSCKETPQICEFSQMCKDCSMNMKNLKVKLPADIEQKLPGILPNFAINGEYWVKLNIVNEDDEDEEVACIEVTTELKSYA